MKLHPRETVIQKVENRIWTACLDAMVEGELTHVELLGIVHNLSGVILKLVLRDERHPDDPSRPAGLE